MRKTFTTLFAIAILAVAATTAQATPIISVNPTADTSTGGLDLFTFSIDNSGGDSYDTIDVTILADAGKEFVNPNNNGIFTPPGGDDSAFLGGNTVAIGLALVGIEGDASKLSGVITTFGGTPTDTLNNAFAQVVGAAGLSGSYTINFALAGAQVLDTVTGIFPVPEPTSLALLGLGLVGFVARRRS